jgi:sodium/hydrogen antiporter
MNWYIVLLVCLGLLILAVAWLPPYLRQLPLSLPIICVAFGFVLFSFPETGPPLDLLEHPYLTQHMTELIVIVALMGAGLKLNRPVGWRSWFITWRLLAITMPLSIVGMAILGSMALGLPPAAALLLGAVLAPTDPVLASNVQVGPPHEMKEDEVRFSLTSEAGLNDGLAFPFTNLAIVVALHGLALGPGIYEWLVVDVVWKIAVGIFVGLLVGQLLSLVIFRYVADAGGSESGDNLVALGITFVSYGLTELAYGYGFLAVFVTALTLRRQERSHHYRERLHELSEQIERLFMMILLVLFGGAIAGGLLEPLTCTGAGFGLACILIVRPLTGLIGLAGVRRPWDEKAAIGFFGIRGVGSFYYLDYAYNTGEFEMEAPFLFAVVGFVVLISIVLHGVTSTPVMRFLERKWRAEREAAE